MLFVLYPGELCLKLTWVKRRRRDSQKDQSHCFVVMNTLMKLLSSRYLRRCSLPFRCILTKKSVNFDIGTRLFELCHILFIQLVYVKKFLHMDADCNCRYPHIEYV